MATVPLSSTVSPARARSASPNFDAAVLLAALWFVGGLLVDGWAHSNLDLSREGFFTPYHAIFYSGFGAVAALVLGGTYSRHVAGEPWRAAIPAGYATTLAGLGIFALGGVLDMLWHLAFGIEQDVAALFSPTHLLLAAGIGAILTGPIRSTLLRKPARSFAAQWPALVALGLFATLVSFFLLWIFSTFVAAGSDPRFAFAELRGAALGELRESWQIRGMGAIVLRSLVMVAVLVWASRRFALPFGASVLLVAMPNVLISLMLAPSFHLFREVLAASVVAGVVADLALSRGAGFDGGTWPSRALGFAVPFFFWATLLLISVAFTHGSWWVVHMLVGAPVFAGLAGLLLTIVVERPALVAAAAPLAPIIVAPLEPPAIVRAPSRPHPVKSKRRARSRAKHAK